WVSGSNVTTVLPGDGLVGTKKAQTGAFDEDQIEKLISERAGDCLSCYEAIRQLYEVIGVGGHRKPGAPSHRYTGPLRGVVVSPARRSPDPSCGRPAAA